MREPGASDVLTHGLVVRPFLTAFLASKPAASMTDGLLVLVHDVIDAMTMEPWFSLKWVLLNSTSIPRELRSSGDLLNEVVSWFCHADFISASRMRSCGRFGPARDGSTVDRSSSAVRE